MIRVEQLSFAYGTRQVLHDISFSIPRGQLVSIPEIGRAHV